VKLKELHREIGVEAGTVTTLEVKWK